MELLLEFNTGVNNFFTIKNYRQYPPCLFHNEYWFNCENNYKEYQYQPKNINAVENANLCGKNMRYAHFAKICEKCGNVPNMR